LTKEEVDDPECRQLVGSMAYCEARLKEITA